MTPIVRRILCEALIVLSIWGSGWVLVLGGAWGMKVQKESYWSETILRQEDYKKLSSREQIMARDQFMSPGSLRAGDAPLRRNGVLRAAYIAEAAGQWLRQFWLLVYGLCVCLRLIARLRVFFLKFGLWEISWPREFRMLTIFSLMALSWYVFLGILLPSGYEAYQRFYLQSFEYLWNARAAQCQQAAGLWPCFFLVYGVMLLVRGWRRIFSAGKSR